MLRILGVLLFLGPFANTALATRGRSWPTYEELLYQDCALVGLIVILILVISLRVLAHLFGSRKNQQKYELDACKLMNALIIGWYAWIALAYLEMTLFHGHVYSCYTWSTPLAFGFPVLAYAAVLEAKGWGASLCKKAHPFLGPAVVAVHVITYYQGERSEPLWDMERTYGMTIMLVALFFSYLSIPKEERPFFAKTKAEPVAGLDIHKVSFLPNRGKCKVCGDPLTADFLRCHDCGTPMHKDCWDYVGGQCVVYGCQSKRKLKLCPA